MSQLGGYPVALATVAVLMALFAFVPGLPFIPFMIGAGCLATAAWVAQGTLRKEAEAKAAAATRKNTGERGQGELSFSLPGDPRLAAEGRLSINLRPGVPTDWRIKRVEHRLDAQGYTTQVECERFTAAPVPITSSE